MPELGKRQQVAKTVSAHSTEPANAASGVPSSAAPAPAITAPIPFAVWAKTVRKLVARPRMSSGARICTTVRRIATLWLAVLAQRMVTKT